MCILWILILVLFKKNVHTLFLAAKERELVIKFDEGAKSYGFRIQYSKPAIVTDVDSGELL